MDQLRKPPTRHLVNDEKATIADKWGTDVTFRVRIWQGENATAVALASQTLNEDGHYYQPHCMTTKLANYIQSGILYHNPFLMLYYEDNLDADGTHQLHQVHFDFYGSVHRLKMFKPERARMEWEKLEFILESEIER